MPGLRNTRLIHKRFEQHHHRTAEGQLTAECVITRPASGPTPPVFDEITGRSILPKPAEVYAGPCRLQREPIFEAQRDVADRTTIADGYRLILPASAAEVRVNDLITMTACDGDPDLVGKLLHVTNVYRGSITWQRDIRCDLYVPTTR